MAQTELTDGRRVVLRALVENPGSPLREVHRTATELDGSPFTYSPPHGDGWNEERWTVRDHLHSLRDAGLARVEENPYPWYSTAEGRERL